MEWFKNPTTPRISRMRRKDSQQQGATHGIPPWGMHLASLRTLDSLQRSSDPLALNPTRSPQEDLTPQLHHKHPEQDRDEHV